MRARRRLRRLQHLLQTGHVVAAEALGAQRGQAAPGLRLAGLTPQHLAIVRGRLHLGTEVGLRRSQQQPRRQVPRVDIQCAVQRGDCPGRAAQQLEHPAPVEPCRGEVGRQFTGPLQRRQRCLVLAAGLQRNTQADMQHGIARILRQRLAQDRHRLRVLAAQLLQLGRQAQRLRAVRRQRQRRGQRRRGALQLAAGHRITGLAKQPHHLRRQARDAVAQQRMNLTCHHRRWAPCLPPVSACQLT